MRNDFIYWKDGKIYWKTPWWQDALIYALMLATWAFWVFFAWVMLTWQFG